MARFPADKASADGSSTPRTTHYFGRCCKSCKKIMHSQSPREGRGRAPSNAPLAFNFSQLSVRLLSAPFPFMYSKFPLPTNGETVASVALPPSGPLQLAGGRVEATLMTAHLPL